ncbi:Hemin transport system permease protein HmuU [Achromobacter animicus]|uniref:Hemin transport system permease protein HmuU n=1 Tax=Achromobacter animicus TaxID=1389935 RepID=A0A6S6Z2J5_9BURK|nr:iron ABC transporter permease [Achromobacter animicus]CAB3657090.1 Hemin transport system permease protein HmuU [Achromobacter animicus]CAB3867798.1 Hemin transport system permease protein HmuU [Achromobacter animicus]
MTGFAPAAPSPAASVPDDPIAAYRRAVRKRLLLTVVLVLAIVASLLADIASGPASLSLPDLLHTLLHPEVSDTGTRVIVWQFRLPYALMALLVGVALGLGGAEMQTMLDNPLASPYTLGVSAAAAFGASLAITLDWHLPALPAGMTVSVSAFACTLLSVLVLERVARWRGGSTLGVVLFGIALVYSFQALVMLLQFVASEEALQGIVFWTMGSLARANWTTVGVMAAALVLAIPFSMRDAWKLTAVRLGEERAASFGIDVKRLRLVSLLRVSALAALAVSFVGTIGFVGLVAPHIARLLLGEDHRYYLPGSALAGALILSLASVASKTVLPGALIPVGIVTSLVGIPFFLTIVVRALKRA